MGDGVRRLGGQLIPPLGARAWRLLAGVVAFEVGTGMTLPVVIVYLHGSRGLGLAAAGLALSAVGAGGLAGTLVAGPVADRWGPGWTAVAGLCLAGAGTAGYLGVNGPVSAIAASAAQGAGFAATWVGIFPLLIRAVDPAARGDVLGTNYGLTNLGLGIGSTLAGFVLAVQPDAFAPLFALDAATYFAFALWLVRLGEVGGDQVDRPAGRVAGAGYGGALHDRALMAATGISLLLVTAGYSQLVSAFPVWATGQVDAPRSLVGFAFAANTWSIAIAQLPVLAFVRTRRRTRAVAGTGVLFALCWLMVLGAGETSSRPLAYAGLVGGAAVFGLGETLLSPSLPAIVNDLAPEEARGRYVAVYGTSWQIGPMIGPAIAGVALGMGEGAPLILGLAGACALAWPAAVLYERLLPPFANSARARRPRPARGP
jgi:MFS family permease